MRRIAGNVPTDEGHSMPRDMDDPADENTTQPPGDKGLSDGELIVAVRDGNISAFESLVRKYRPALLSTAYARLGNAALAEDAVQEAFLSAFRSLPSYDSRWSFRSWLWSILINQCKQEYRRKKRDEDKTSHVANEPPASEVAPDERLLQTEQKMLISRMLDQLPPDQAEAIQLRFFGEMKYEEISDAMRCGLTTAKNRVRTGLEKLSRLIQSKRLGE